MREVILICKCGGKLHTTLDDHGEVVLIRCEVCGVKLNNIKDENKEVKRNDLL